MTQFEKTFHLITRPWFIVAYAALVVLAYHFYDQTIAFYFHSLDLRTTAHGLNILTAFGKWKIYVLLFALAGISFRYLKKNALYEARCWFLLGCVLIPNIVGAIIKVIVSRSRPELLFDGGSFGFYWFQWQDMYWSFPSGHTITVVSLASGLGVLFPKYFYALLALALLVVMSRVFLYFHYLSDVLTGFYLAILVVGLFTAFLKKNQYLNRII